MLNDSTWEQPLVIYTRAWLDRKASNLSVSNTPTQAELCLLPHRLWTERCSHIPPGLGAAAISPLDRALWNTPTEADYICSHILQVDVSYWRSRRDFLLGVGGGTFF